MKQFPEELIPPVFTWARSIVALLVALFLFAGAGAFVGSLIPYSMVKARVDRMASDGKADGFTEEVYAPAAYRARAGGIVLLAYGFACWVVRRRAAGVLSGLVPSLRRVGARSAQALNGYWSTASVWERWALLAILLAGIAVRVCFIQGPLRHDEAYTVEAYARKPIYLLLTDLRAPNNHVFHTLLVGLSIRFFGDAEWAVRIPVLLAGWLSIGVSFLCFRRWAGGAAGLVTAALVASESAQIEYSVLARGYGIAGLLFLILLYVVHDWPTSLTSRCRWWAFALCALLGLCTLLSMTIALAIVGAWYLVRVWETEAPLIPAIRTMATASLAVGAAALLFYLPALLVTGPAMFGGIRYAAPMALSKLAGKVIATFGVMGSYWSEGWPPALTVAVAVCAAVGLLLHRRIFGGSVPLLAVAVGVCLVFVVLQRVVFFRRVYLLLSPLYLGLAAAAASWLLVRLRPPAAAAPLLAAAVLCTGLYGVVTSRSVYYSDEIGHARDIQAATNFLRTRIESGDHVSVTLVSSMPVYYYFRKAGIPLNVLDSRKTEARRLFALEDKLALDRAGGSSEDVVMSDMELVLRVDGFDTERLPPRQLLWETDWARIWFYPPPLPLL